MGWHAFLSYSRQQYHSAESLALKLQDQGLTIWFDVQQLEPGADWQQDIQDGLGQSESVLLLASRAALASPYVEREWRRALELGHPIIVAMVEWVRLPGELRRSPVIDCRGDFDAGVERVQQAILNPGVPTPFVRPLPRLSPGVARTACALLLDDLRHLGFHLTAIVIWALLFRQSSIPQLAVEWLLRFLRQMFGSRPEFEWLVPLLFAGGFLYLLIWLIGSILDSRTRRFLRHDLKSTILAPRKILNQWPLVLLWLALASGHLPAVIEQTSRAGVQPVELPVLVLLAGLILIWWTLGRIQQRLRPRLPNADLLRWVGVDGVPDSWRADLYAGGIRTALRPSAATPVLPDATTAVGLRLRAVAEPADLPVLDTIRPLLTEIGGVIVPVGADADYSLLILSHASSRRRVAEVLGGGSRVVGIIASRFTLPHELEGLRKLQLVDFSRQDRGTLRAALRLLTARDDAERSQLQPYLEPVSLSRAAPPKLVQQMAGSLLSLFLLTLLMLGMVIWQRDALAAPLLPMGSLAMIALLLLICNARARRGRQFLPRPVMIILAFVPLILMALIARDLPVQVSSGVPLYPTGWIMLLGTTAITTARFIHQFIRHPHTLGGEDVFGMPPVDLRLLQSVTWIAACMVLMASLSTGSGR